MEREREQMKREKGERDSLSVSYGIDFSPE